MPCATRARICVACVPNGPRAEERLPVRIITRVSRYHIDSIDTVSIVSILWYRAHRRGLYKRQLRPEPYQWYYCTYSYTFTETTY